MFVFDCRDATQRAIVATQEDMTALK